MLQVGWKVAGIGLSLQLGTVAWKNGTNLPDICMLRYKPTGQSACSGLHTTSYQFVCIYFNLNFNSWYMKHAKNMIYNIIIKTRSHSSKCSFVSFYVSYQVLACRWPLSVVTCCCKNITKYKIVFTVFYLLTNYLRIKR